jgi:glycosyltransferase involved in cell wall biosynthesis
MIFSVTITDNKENIIGDAIRSVVDHVDRVLVVDTGITDQTIERAREVAGDKLMVTKHGWVDFSTARNFGIDVARRRGATWIVIVDSDERLNLCLDLRSTLTNFRKNILLIESDDGHYLKEKILRAASEVHYFGPTHEVMIGGERATLAGATFSELPKSAEQYRHKFERDVKLLTEFVKKHPDDPRWWYYLGASYEGIGEHVRAANAFGECVVRRRFGDEAAWAAYKQAEQLFLLNQFEEAIMAAARGMGANATFAECAWIAAVSATRLNRNDQAIAWAHISEAVGRYKGCGTNREYFRHMPALYELPYDVLRFVLPDEVGREKADVDFHAAKRARVGATDEFDLDRLSVSRSASWPNRDEARSMLRPLPLSSMCPSARSVQIRFKTPDGWHPMNPSICLHKGKMMCVVRTVNYSLNGRQYTINDPENVVRTENYLGELGPNGEFIGPTLMRDLDTSPRQPSQIVGYEDIRLVSIRGPDGDVLAGSSTVCDRDPERRMIARLDFDRDGNIERAVVQPTNQQHEKNWMPLSVSGEFTYIYSLDPTAILPGPLRHCPFALEHLRGGAAIAFNDGYLCVMHETIEANESRIYLHRFVRLDPEFNVTAVSPAWIFAHHGIEFCAGLVLDGTSLVLSYGITDREAWIMRVDVREVEAMRWITPTKGPNT